MPPDPAVREANRQLAIRSRLDAAAVKRDLRAGRITLHEAVEDPRARSLTMLDLCFAAPKWGRKNTPELLHRLGIRSNLRVRELTGRQRENFRLGLADPAFVPDFAPTWG